jgi:hypothetical protein
MPAKKNIEKINIFAIKLLFFIRNNNVKDIIDINAVSNA